MIGSWWRRKEIPKVLRKVEIVSLHKAGDRLDLYNKRGIGLVSKLVLIMETILLKRINDVLEKAGTQSKAQGGARKGTLPTELVLTLINVINHAMRNGKPLHVIIYDLIKFFDRIPPRGFEDTYIFFGFDDEVISLAKLFWEDFVAVARTLYGDTEEFDILIGNIQGLVGSPRRSGMFLDMVLRTLEKEQLGYRFTSDHFGYRPEHKLDDDITLIYGLAWVDDFTSIEESAEAARKSAAIFNKFINHYTMNFAIKKCQHFVLNDTVKEEERIVITDYNRVAAPIPVANGDQVFRCLGVMLNLNLEWQGHIAFAASKIREFNSKAHKRHSPPWVTAKLVNSNAIPMITYGLPVVDLEEKEISKMQNLLVASVKKDGRHSNYAPTFAYTMPVQDGGYNIGNVSAAYMAAKISGIYNAINGVYSFAASTTRTILLDLQRATKSTKFPLENGFDKWNNAVVKTFPKYIREAGKAIRKINLSITPSTSWDLDRITISTFAYCIAEWDKTNYVENLQAAGMQYMHQISSWFQVDRENSSPIARAINNRALGLGFILPADDLIDKVGEIEGFGSQRTQMIITMVKQGVINILSSTKVSFHISIDQRRTETWQRAKLALLGTRSEQGGNIYSDGSKGTRAGYAVVNEDGEELAAGGVNEIYSSQRAELYGFLAATFLKPNARIRADPLNLIRTITRAVREEIPAHEWRKVNNRALIRNIAALATNADNFIWIRGHQDNSDSTDAICNREADALAKKAERNPYALALPESWEYADSYICLADDNLFEGDVRKEALQRLITHDREAFVAHKGRERFRHIGWWMIIPASADMVDFGATRFKLFTKTLPTHDRLAKRFPGIYGELKCPCCGLTKESDTHTMTDCAYFDGERARVWSGKVSKYESQILYTQRQLQSLRLQITAHDNRIHTPK